MPNLIDRFTALWRNRNQTPEAVIGAQPANPQAVGAVTFTTQRDRRNRVTDCRDMAAEDPRAKQSTATLARDATKGGFTTQVSGPRAAQAQAAADALLARLDIFTRLDDWARLTLRDGDTFLELGVAANGEIVQVTRKPTLEMYRFSDDYDRLIRPVPTRVERMHLVRTCSHHRFRRTDGGSFRQSLSLKQMCT